MDFLNFLVELAKRNIIMLMVIVGVAVLCLLIPALIGHYYGRHEGQFESFDELMSDLIESLGMPHGKILISLPSFSVDSIGNRWTIILAQTLKDIIRNGNATRITLVSREEFPEFVRKIQRQWPRVIKIIESDPQFFGWMIGNRKLLRLIASSFDHFPIQYHFIPNPIRGVICDIERQTCVPA